MSTLPRIMRGRGWPQLLFGHKYFDSGDRQEVQKVGVEKAS